MRRILFVALLGLAMPMAVFANSTSTDFIVFGGSSTLGGVGGTGALFDTTSTVNFAMGFNGNPLLSGNLGTLSFTTGSLLSHSGNLEIFAGGGSFTITGSGTGLPGGVIFSGTFNGEVTLETFDNGLGYMLVCESNAFSGCSVSGTWYNGQKASGGLIVSAGVGGGINLAYVNLQNPVVPEPGTLSLLGTGLLGIGAVVRRKLRA